MGAPRSRFLTATAIVWLIVFSSLSTACANNATSLQNVNLTGYQAPLVRSHKITATELKAMENKLGVSTSSQSANVIVDGHGTGLRAPTPSEWQKISENAQITDAVTLASAPTASVDNSLSPYFPPVGNQGTGGACVGFSVAYYTKTFQEAKEHGWNLSGATWGGSYPGSPTPTYQNKIMSPSFVDHLINGGTNDGCSIEDAIGIVCDIGVSSWYKMPFLQADWTTWPSEAAWAEAPYYRGNASGYQYLSLDSSSGIQSLKNLLATGTLVSIGVDANEFPVLTSNDFWTLDNYKPAGNESIDHANTIVGYDDNITYNESGTIHQGAFKIVNSWGQGGWEHVPDGFYWISYEAMRKRVGPTSDGIFFYDMIGYKPELITSFTVSHQHRNECQITVGAGNPNSPIATKNFTEHINAGNYPFPQNIMMLDITEFKNQLPSVTNQSYFLQVNDSGTPTLGTITSFSLGNVTSTDVPRPTINNVNVCVTLFYPAVEQANVTLPEFPTFLLCPLIAAFTLLATMIKRKPSE